ncbi:MAG: NUDIX domain-containing protein [Candidatus Binatia bacterium]
MFTVLDGALHVLLVEARAGSFAGWWALPGGRLRPDESLDEGAARELAAQTGVADVYLEQLYTFGHPQRDPGGRVVSVAYVALIPHRGTLAPPPSPKYRQTAWRPVADLPSLAYDHATVVEVAVARLRAKLTYTNLVYTLLPHAFTLGELQAMYEAILGRTLDRRNFRKKILSLGLLCPLARVRRGPHRPAALYGFRRRRPMAVEML